MCPGGVALSSSDDGVTIYLPNSVMRERSRVPATTVESLRKVKGYFRPRYIDVLDDGRRVGALGDKDIQRIEDGYGCGKCFAYFSERLADCPSCGERLDPNSDVVDFSPDYWKPSASRTSLPTFDDAA